MPPQVYNFNINKFSVYQRDKTWQHFPQRSELSISFIRDQSDEISVVVHWRGTNLDSFSLLVTDKCVTTVLCKSPSIGVKQCDKYGNILKRFQISFTEDNEYTKCCDMLTLVYKFNVNNKERDNFSSSSSSSSQVLPVASSQTQPPQHSQPYVQYFLQSQPMGSQQQVFVPIASSQPEPRMAFLPLTQEFAYPGITSTNPINIYSHLPEQIPAISMDSLEELKKLTDSSLRAAIRNQIKLNPEFVDFVNRLDRIIGDI
ncbi:hypothetical protein Cantr_01548 [Candida viswanathii]|uniref:Uncharacterized protein n=1 Tax=Candida viswanathii TaxID=5486 RepID=A0A367YLA4_9ASCO|nr:hypothetical protein Cantr_01548 [Candida viswanathii]